MQGRSGRSRLPQPQRFENTPKHGTLHAKSLKPVKLEGAGRGPGATLAETAES